VVVAIEGEGVLLVQDGDHVERGHPSS
jgi:hypothetical protein